MIITENLIFVYFNEFFDINILFEQKFSLEFELYPILIHLIHRRVRSDAT